MNKNPTQTEQSNKDLSQILNPKQSEKEKYWNVQKNILKDIFK